MTENELSKIVVDLCVKIHRILGPGLLESAYEKVLCYELTKAGLSFERQQKIGVVYEEIVMDVGFRADIIVGGKLLLELKSTETYSSAPQDFVNLFEADENKTRTAYKL
jgi:GxxExxY protein